MYFLCFLYRELYHLCINEWENIQLFRGLLSCFKTCQISFRQHIIWRRFNQFSFNIIQGTSQSFTRSFLKNKIPCSLYLVYWIMYRWSLLTNFSCAFWIFQFITVGGSAMNAIHSARNNGKRDLYNLDKWDRQLLERDFRLTGEIRKQSDKAVAPEEFKTNSWWKVRVKPLLFSRLSMALTLFFYSSRSNSKRCNFRPLLPFSMLLFYQRLMK